MQQVPPYTVTSVIDEIQRIAPPGRGLTACHHLAAASSIDHLRAHDVRSGNELSCDYKPYVCKLVRQKSSESRRPYRVNTLMVRETMST